MTPEGDEQVERAMAAVLERLERDGRLDEAWLERAFPVEAADVRDLLSIHASLCGGRLPGSRLGPFRIRRFLGSGGMGSVYVADVDVPTDGLERGARVALKVLHPHLCGQPDAEARLRREVEASRRVRHPGVVAAHAAFAEPEGGGTTLFLAMDVHEGRTLREVLDEDGPVSESIGRAVAKDVLDALAALHRHGVVHRDLKPGNLLRRDDGRLVLLDLGLAWLADERIRLSRSGQFLGTLAYASPEQFSAASPRGDGRMDLWSLGATLFELATGYAPFDETLPASSAVEDGLGAPRLQIAAPDSSRAYAAFVDRLLELRPDDRFASAEAAQAALASASDEGGGLGDAGGASGAPPPPPLGLDVQRRLCDLLAETRRGRGGVLLVTSDQPERVAAGLRVWCDRVVRGGGRRLEVVAESATNGASPSAPGLTDRRSMLAALARTPAESGLLVVDVGVIGEGSAGGHAALWTAADAASQRPLLVVGVPTWEAAERMAPAVARRPRVTVLTETDETRG